MNEEGKIKRDGQLSTHTERDRRRKKLNVGQRLKKLSVRGVWAKY
jgi:hypothetical protein